VFTVTSESFEETVKLGKMLGTLAGPGDIIAMTGDLGSGKTHFAMGVARGLGVAPSVPVTSPTFTLLNCYSGRLPLYHFDLYRLAGAVDLYDLGFEEYFYGEGVCLIEWAERLGDSMPDERLEVSFVYVDESRRTISFTPTGSRYVQMAAALHVLHHAEQKNL
jgi:tRNA threonylcarbamoyladenosine biosynthesis protein TsaE